MNVLVIAPKHADLPNASAEIAAIQRHHQATVLSGPVRERDIERAVDEGPFDIIWWISHGSPEGVLLSNGLLSIDGVGQYVRASGARLCVLNTCDSEDVAEAIIAGGNADMICTIGPVLNQDAIRLGSLLARELDDCDNFQDAYEIVAPLGGPYRYLKAIAQYRRHDALREAATHSQLQLSILVLAVLVLLGGIGIFREISIVEGNQHRIISNQEKIIDNQERNIEAIRNLESRVIRIQLGQSGADYLRSEGGGP